MEKFDIFRDIAERTGGDIYIGVVGPVRSGKSVFIKRFMELMVLPHIEDPHDYERAKDSLPQCGAGRTVTTTEPKFIPDEGVEITVKEGISFRVRLVDCVGYTVEGALGYEEEEGPRMVTTPWFEEDIPFQEAAEVGTRKVIAEHSTVGVLVTTDGSITDIPRESYAPAERRVVQELKEVGKPFVIVLNSAHPRAESTLELASQLEMEYDVATVALDCLHMTQEDVLLLVEQLLYEFPVREVEVTLPAWVEVLEPTHWLRSELEQTVSEVVRNVRRLRDVNKAIASLQAHERVQEVLLKRLDMGQGIATLQVEACESLFFRVLEEITGCAITGKADLVPLMRELALAKREYDRVAEALKEVRQLGYGMVPPTLDEMTFDEPELIRQGSRFGVRLRASAPTLHFIRADIHTEVTPLIGTEQQCEELVRYLLNQFEDDPKRIWQSDIFGKPLHELVREGIQSKLFRMPEDVQEKLQETLERLINEGSAGLICIII